MRLTCREFSHWWQAIIRHAGDALLYQMRECAGFRQLEAETPRHTECGWHQLTPVMVFTHLELFTHLEEFHNLGTELDQLSQDHPNDIGIMHEYVLAWLTDEITDFYRRTANQN